MRTFIFFLGILVPAAHAQDMVIRGYDPVSYFSQNKAVKGADSISSIYSGVKWLFSSSENRKAFIDSPEKYIPQFNGHCAYAAANNYIYDADPEVWTIVEGKLYLNYSVEVRMMWAAQRDSMIAAARKNWPALIHQKKH